MNVMKTFLLSRSSRNGMRITTIEGKSQRNERCRCKRGYRLGIAKARMAELGGKTGHFVEYIQYR
jgi:hypothetical protein